MKLFARILITIILLGGLIDLPRNLQFGQLTAMGLLTILYTIASWFLLLACPRLPKAASVMGWFLLFLLWSLFTSIISPWTSLTFNGAQNLLTYSAFAGLLLLSAIESYHRPYLSEYLGSALRWIILIAGSLSLLAFDRHFLRILPNSLSYNFQVGERSFAIFALLSLAWNLATWRCGSRNGLWWAIIIISLIALSLSRMAIFAALVLFVLSKIQVRRLREWLKVILIVSAIYVISFLALTYVESLRQRFFYGDTSMQLGGVAINVSGRTAMWQSVLNSFWESPWIGKGAGSSNMATAASILPRGHLGIVQPHNDYLRILHDYGVIGLLLWLVAFCGLMKANLKAWVWANRNQTLHSDIHLAALLALVATAIMMFTDNIIIYIYAMAPLGVLIGTSLGTLARERARSNALARRDHSQVTYNKSKNVAAPKHPPPTCMIQLAPEPTNSN